MEFMLANDWFHVINNSTAKQEDEQQQQTPIQGKVKFIF